MKTYPCTTRDIVEAMGLDDEGPVCFYIKGHHEPAEFKRVLDEYLGRTRTRFADYHQISIDTSVEKIEQHWWRSVRAEGGQIVSERKFIGAGANARGAFPVTVLSIREWTL